MGTLTKDGKMKIRLYYGYDCDSVNGFNNGYYLHDYSIEVKDIDEAFKQCEYAIKELWGGKSELEELDNGFELITGYYDNEGTELTEEQFQELNENEESGSWSYVYVTYEEID